MTDHTEFSCGDGAVLLLCTEGGSVDVALLKIPGRDEGILYIDKMTSLYHTHRETQSQVHLANLSLLSPNLPPWQPWCCVPFLTPSPFPSQPFPPPSCSSALLPSLHTRVSKTEATGYQLSHGHQFFLKPPRGGSSRQEAFGYK